MGLLIARCSSTIVGLVIALGLIAQNNSVLDPVGSPCSIHARVEPYATLREADVMWSCKHPLY